MLDKVLHKDHVLWHYGSIAGLLFLVYFLFGPMFMKLETDYYAHLRGPQTQVAITQPTPAPGLGTFVDKATRAAESVALRAALRNEETQLSYAQQTISSLAQSYGLNSKFASGGVAAFTQPSPKQQVITLATGVKTTMTPPPASLTDDQIERSLKKTLAETTIRTDVHNDLTVHWEDKPMSPLFAAYMADGASGAGYTLRKTPYLNLDALLVRKTSGSKSNTEFGFGADHVFKGTSGSLGAALIYDLSTKSFKPSVFVGLHF